jgi:hypothetical protein
MARVLAEMEAVREKAVRGSARSGFNRTTTDIFHIGFHISYGIDP